jgi:serine protease Do
MKIKQILGTILIASLGGLFALGINNRFEARHQYFSGQNAGIPAHFANYSSGSEPVILPDFRRAAQMSIQAVVYIKTTFQQKNSYYDEFFGMDPFKDFFNPFPRQHAPQQEIQASGSGVIISDDGYIVTNNHVVADADQIDITLNDKRSFTAKIIGTDPSTDLALLKIDATKLPYLIYGNSDSLDIGEWVLAVGNPFNLTSTVTAGIVSAKARNINIPLKLLSRRMLLLIREIAAVHWSIQEEN